MHAHIRYFNKITSTLKFPNILNTSIKLMLFPFSLEGAALIWLEKEPPRLIFTWDDLVSKFINQFFSPSKTTNLRNEITNFQQCFDESFNEAWDRFKDLLRACPHHGFSELHQLDTFYNALNSKDQDSLNSVAGGYFLDKMPRECLAITESKSKVHYSCNKPVVAKVSMNTSSSSISPDVAELKDMVKASLLKSNSTPGFPPVPNNQNVQLNQRNNQNHFNQNQNRGNNFNHEPVYQPLVFQPLAYHAPAYHDPAYQASAPQTQVSNPRPNQRPSIPYPSRLQDQKLRDKANDQREKFFQIFKDLNFNISFIDAFILMPKFGPSIKSLLTNKDKLYFDADPRVPLILERSFLKIERVLIDVFEGELTLHVGKEAITFNLDQTSRYAANYNEMTAKRIDIIDMACEEYSQEVLAFLNDDPSLPPPNQGNYLPEVRKELKIYEAKSDKSSIDEPPEVELKDLPPHLEYTFLEYDDKLPVIIAQDLSVEEKTALITVLKSHKRAIAWKLSDIKGIDPEFCTHKILMEEDSKPAGQHQRRVNPKIHDVIKQEVLKFLDAGLIYPNSDSPWVSPIHCVPKKGGFTVVENEDNELIPTHLDTGWRVCIDYRKLNESICKEHFPLPSMDQMLERLAGNQYYCFLDGTFQRCMMAIFHDMIEKTMEVFMDDFSVFRNSFQSCLSHLERMLKRCEDTNLCLNWEKSHFMVKEGIVLGHKISMQGIKVDKAKVDVITKLPHPTTVKGIRSFLDHSSFYRRFIKDFSKIARPMTRLLEKDTLFIFSKECVEAFQTLKRKITEAPILIAPDWDMPFELMCDASDFAIGAVLGQRQDKHFKPIHYASKTITKVESNYTTTEKEMLAVVYAFKKFRSYLIMNKSIVYTDHSVLFPKDWIYYLI
uniref:DNA-directed DNA polymerase n=1 Tax=Tanacetum cinerariifolium TaxID=118510 RepID=A0A6L2NKN5_TANCI|nr:DNA-directed DNA polymerase [Tanacetum cinerariifolium]